MKAANTLSLLYKSEGNLEAARKLHLQPSQYKTLPVQELATEAAAYNIKADQVKEPANGATAYSAVSEARRWR